MFQSAYSIFQSGYSIFQSEYFIIHSEYSIFHWEYFIFQSEGSVFQSEYFFPEWVLYIPEWLLFDKYLLIKLNIFHLLIQKYLNYIYLINYYWRRSCCYICLSMGPNTHEVLSLWCSKKYWLETRQKSILRAYFSSPTDFGHFGLV